MVREYLTKKLRSAGVERIAIERTANKFSVIIHSSRPGIIIGRSGTGTESLTKDIERVVRKARGKPPP